MEMFESRPFDNFLQKSTKFNYQNCLIVHTNDGYENLNFLHLRGLLILLILELTLAILILSIEIFGFNYKIVIVTLNYLFQFILKMVRLVLLINFSNNLFRNSSNAL